jgi:NAD(P)-dependent dehydrogenase (short-subunit alcohol dehydrogenase family)
MSTTLDDRHAVVTGASRGIGAETARQFAARGADVALLARSKGDLERRCAELAERHGGTYVPVTADVTDPKAVGEAFDEARSELGQIDVLVNNAGAADSSPFTHLDADDWHQMIAVNLDSVYYCTREVLPGMLDRGDGRVVNNASTTGLTGYKYVAHYAAAKHGVVGVTKSLAKEVAERGVTVNAVCPGYTDTDLVDDGAAEVAEKLGKPVEAVKEDFKAMNPQDRFVEPAEVASTIAWLCEPAQRSINGETIAIDGGETA